MGVFSGRGQGKLILMGEHAVVYGKPALGTHLSQGIRVSLVEIALGAGKRPRADAAAGAGLDPLDPVGRSAFIAMARRAGLDPRRYALRTASNLPQGQGLGSSAAFSIAASRAALAASGAAVSDAAVLELAQVMETVFHGAPSGMDAVLALGQGPTLYRKGQPAAAVRPGCAIPIVVLLSGTAPSTRAMVAKVRRKATANPAKVGRIIDEIASLVEAGLGLMTRGDLAGLGRVFDENHRLLKALGVSAPVLESLREKALKAGALGAKLTGAGGGGALICLAADRGQARRILNRLKPEGNCFINIIESPRPA